MRLLYITAGYPFGGSGESFLEPELTELAALGVEIDVLPMRRDGAARAMPAGVRLRPETIGSSVRRAVRTRGRRTGDLLRVLRRSPRVLPRNAAVVPVAAAVAAALEHERPYDHIHAHWLTHTSTCALALSHLTGTPFSITAHRWDVYVENLFAAKAERARFVRFIARTCREAFERQVGPGTGRLVDLHMGVEPSGPATRPDADPAPTAGPTSNGPASAGPRLVTAGSLLPVKGQRHLVAAVGLLREQGVPATLDVYGEGPLRAELEAQVAELGLRDAITLHGVLPRAELAAAYASGRHDVFVMPSVDLGGGVHEGVPVSIMEAMSAGLPVVATDTGGIPELVVDGVTGLLVDQQSAAALAGAVRRLWDDPSLRRSLTAGAADHVRREFDAATIARQLLELMRG